MVGRRRPGLNDALREIDARLAALHPAGASAAARDAERIVIDGRRLLVRRGDEILGPGGQRQFGFAVEGIAEPGPAAPPTLPVEPPVLPASADGAVPDLLAMAAERVKFAL